MSQENVEVVRRVIGLMNERPGEERDSELLGYFAPDVVIDMSRRVFNPDVYEGHDRLRRLGRDVREVWKDFHIEVERMIETGDSVVVIETRRGHGQASELQVTQRAAALWTLRDGLVTRMETDIDPSEALAAAGETE